MKVGNWYGVGDLAHRVAHLDPEECCWQGTCGEWFSADVPRAASGWLRCQGCMSPEEIPETPACVDLRGCPQPVQCRVGLVCLLR